jgi:hypothetical protein
LAHLENEFKQLTTGTSEPDANQEPGTGDPEVPQLL